MSNEEKWSLLWNHDVQFGFVCGAFAGVFGLVLMFFALDWFARIVTSSRKFCDSMDDVYSSIADAHEVWFCALKHPLTRCRVDQIDATF